MSMPSFPESGIDLTKEQALNMLLGSIAMEELALSHIMNAEGEKLQYILGTLHDGQKSCATTKEVLQINRSISDLLERVAQNQLLLKSKLTQVLEAMESCNPCEPDTTLLPCVPCRPVCVLKAARGGIWQKGTQLCWCRVYCQGAEPCWSRAVPNSIYLSPTRAVQLNYSFQLNTGEGEGATMALQSLKQGIWQDIAVIRATESERCLAVVSGSVVLHPEACMPTPSPVAFVLREPQSVGVKQATLSIVEL